MYPGRLLASGNHDGVQCKLSTGRGSKYHASCQRFKKTSDMRISSGTESHWFSGESWLRWDESTYQGCSLLALKLLLQRFSYSIVWCNKVLQIKCFLFINVGWGVSTEDIVTFVYRFLRGGFPYFANAFGEYGSQVNCLAVKDSELGCSLRLPLEVTFYGTQVHLGTDL